MKIKTLVAISGLILLSGTATADLTPWTDYEVSDAVWSVTTILVDANMDDAYLEGLKKTWVSSNETAIKLGYIEDYSILRSDLPQSGDFNLLLMIKYANTSDLAPSRERYEAFMKEVGKSTTDERTEFAQKNYPDMREITGQYLMRAITLK